MSLRWKVIFLAKIRLPSSELLLEEMIKETQEHLPTK